VVGYFTRIEVHDPHLLPQLAWEKLPPSEKALLTQAEFSSQQWAPLDKRRYRIEPESYRTESLMANVGVRREKAALSRCYGAGGETSYQGVKR
jgi:hypothetical protein